MSVARERTGHAGPRRLARPHRPLASRTRPDPGPRGRRAAGRLPGCRLCGRVSRPARADPRARPAVRRVRQGFRAHRPGREIPRGRDELRRRDPRRRPEDAGEPVRPRQPRGGGEARSASLHHRIHASAHRGGPGNVAAQAGERHRGPARPPGDPRPVGQPRAPRPHRNGPLVPCPVRCRGSRAVAAWLAAPRARNRTRRTLVVRGDGHHPARLSTSPSRL